MNSPKETYLEMIKALREARTYSQYRSIERHFLTQEYIKFNTENGVYPEPTSEYDKTFKPSFDFFSATLPSDKMINEAEEKITDNEATLHLPLSIRERVFFTLENGAWKYDLDNEAEPLSNQ